MYNVLVADSQLDLFQTRPEGRQKAQGRARGYSRPRPAPWGDTPIYGPRCNVHDLLEHCPECHNEVNLCTCLEER